MSAATVKKNRESTLKGGRWWKEVGWRHIVAILMIIYCLVPLLYVLSVSLNPGATLTGSNSLFSNVSLENFMALGSGKYAAYWSWVVNSLIVSTTTAIGTVLMGAAAAYAFSRFRFKGRRGTLTGLLLVQMFPQMLAFVALYLLLLGIQDIFPILGLNSKLGPDLCLPRWRARLEHLPALRLLQLDSAFAGRGSHDRRCDARPDLLDDHHAAGSPGSGGRWPAELHLLAR